MTGEPHPPGCMPHLCQCKSCPVYYTPPCAAKESTDKVLGELLSLIETENMNKDTSLFWSMYLIVEKAKDIRQQGREHGVSCRR